MRHWFVNNNTILATKQLMQIFSMVVQTFPRNVKSISFWKVQSLMKHELVLWFMNYSNTFCHSCISILLAMFIHVYVAIMFYITTSFVGHKRSRASTRNGLFCQLVYHLPKLNRCKFIVFVKIYNISYSLVNMFYRYVLVKRNEV